MARESISRSTFVKGIAATAVVACSLGALTIPEYSTVKKGGNFVPGTYNASAKGMESDVVVTITVDDHSITDAKIDVSGETAGIGAAIGDEVSAQIMNAQSSAIDGVAGATVSSTAVKEALDAAIAKAEKGEDPVDPNAVADTEAAADAATEAATEAAAQEAAPAAETGALTAGTYSASAKGMESDIPVEITVDENGKITDVSVDVSGETAGIGAEIGDTVKEQILAAQSADIEGVSGATVSSTAVKEALTSALAQAAGSSDEAEAAEAAETGALTAGTYSASAKGMESDIPVEITVDENGKITDVSVDVSGETAGIGAEIGDTVKEQILAAQSADIEGVSGATVSSTAVKEALTAALAQAAGSSDEAEATEAAAEEETEADAEGTLTGTAEGMNGDVTAKVVLDGDKIVSITLDVSGETKNIGGKIGDEMAQKMLDAQSADVDGVTGATITSDAVKAAVKAALAKANGEDVEVEDATEALAAGYTAGTYTATAAGMMGDVSVEATFDESSLTDVKVDVSGETPELGGAAGEVIAKEFLEAQSADVDAVAGSTVTSNALKEAMADIFAQASK